MGSCLYITSYLQTLPYIFVAWIPFMDVGLAIESPDTTVQYNMWSNEDICRQLDEHCLSKSNNEQLHEESSYELCRKELQ